MTTTDSEIYYDPYDAAFEEDPYPIWKRLRDERPLYYNDRYGFYAVSRFQDVERCFSDWKNFPSSRGNVIEMIKGGGPDRAETVVWEDPPSHDIHRGMLSRVFTPRRVAALEPQVRDFCARCLDPFVGTEGFDFVHDLAHVIPLSTIGMLMGMPESFQGEIKARLGTQASQSRPAYSAPTDETLLRLMEEYIAWRKDHPSDDVTTELLQAEYQDEQGKTCRLTPDQLLNYVLILTEAGNETTNRLISWIGKFLADYPEQRRAIAADRNLIPNAIEEILRYEPPVYVLARSNPIEVAFHGEKVPEGSVVALLLTSANHDERQFPDPDRFDIRRKIGRTTTFGYGIHFCLGAALARLEGRLTLDEVLNRFPEWEVDTDKAVRLHNSISRGWDSLPVVVR
jgi:cytochrome P450